MTNPHQLYRYGTVLLWLGVLAWAPYFALRFMGESPSMMTFLPFHLVGVIGGARLRTSAREKLGIPKEKRRGYKRVAHWIVIASILVWVPYYALKLAGQPAPLEPFLTVHLIGIFGGTSLMIAGGLRDKLQKRDA